MKRLAVAAGAISFCVVNAGLPAWGEVGVTEKEILIGSCSALTGPNGETGVHQLEGARAYLEHVNEAGGIHGRKVRLLALDDVYDANKAGWCFQSLLQKSVFAAAFFVGSPPASKYAPLAEANKLPILGFTTGAQFMHAPFRRYIINVRASYFDEARAEVDHLWNDLGVRRVGIIYQDDAFGAAGLEGVRSALDKHGATLVAQSSFTANTVDVDGAIQRVRSAGPEAVILVSIYTPEAEILKRSKMEGWSPLFLTIAGRDTLVKLAGKSGDGTVVALSVPSPELTALPTVGLYHSLLKKNVPSGVPGYISFEGFVDAMVLVEGLRRAGKDLSREKFIDSIEALRDLDIGLGPQFKVNYSRYRHKAFDSVQFAVIHDGRLLPLESWKGLRNGK